MKSISVLYLRLASEWKDFIGGVHEIASAACPPVFFFVLVLGVDIFMRLCLDLVERNTVFSYIGAVLLRIALCSKCRAAECLNTVFAQKIGNDGGAMVTAVPAVLYFILLLRIGNFEGVKLLIVGNSEDINLFHA
jgi:hypothetical protein